MIGNGRDAPAQDIPFRLLPAGPPPAGSFAPGASVTVERLATGDEAAITISRGQLPTGGYGITVMAVRREGSQLTVICRLNDPAPGAMVTMALTFPHVAIAVPQAALPPPGGYVVAVSTDGKVLAKCNIA